MSAIKLPTGPATNDTTKVESVAPFPNRLGASPSASRRESRFIVVVWVAIFATLAGLSIFSLIRNSKSRIHQAFHAVKASHYALDQIESLIATINDASSQSLPAKDQLLAMRNWLYLSMLHVSREPLILVGKQGWLYLTGQNILRYYLNEEPFTSEQLAKWQHAFEQRSALVERLGGRLVILIVPEKISIYPEYLPPGYQKAHPGCRLDQLQTYLQQTACKVMPLDARPLLWQLKKRSTDPIYLLTDSHWNNRCATDVYQWLAAKCQKAGIPIAPVPASQIILSNGRFAGGDCSRILGLSGIVVEQAPILKLVNGENYEIQATGIKSLFTRTEPNEQVARAPIATKCPSAPKQASAIIFHDSFFQMLRPLFAESFASTHFWWTRDLNFELINRERPRLVIWEMVERHLFDDPPPDVFWDDFAQYDRPIYHWNAASHIPLSVYNATMDGATLTATNEDPRIFIPRLTNVPGRPMALRIKLKQPTETIVQVFWSVPGTNGSFSQECSHCALNPIGSEEVVLRLPANCSGPLRIDPGSAAGKYSILDIQINGRRQDKPPQTDFRRNHEDGLSRNKTRRSTNGP